MEETVNDMSVASIFWQSLEIVILLAILYFLYKLYKYINKKNI